MQIDIHVPYTTQPKMKKYAGDYYNKSPDTFYLKQKKIELNKFGTQLWAQSQQAEQNLLVRKACNFLSTPETNNICELALRFEEDLAIMHNGRLAAICFCFPSSWIPAERIGQTLTEIHTPVADNEKLLSASEKLSKIMADSTQGPFRRQVWTVSQNSGLSNHPLIKIDKIPKSINDLYFRMETQTTVPIGDNTTSLFFVKVDVIPLSEIWHKIGGKIRASINSMTDAIIEYKNLQDIKPILNNVLIM